MPRVAPSASTPPAAGASVVEFCYTEIVTRAKSGFASLVLLLIILGTALGVLIYSQDTGSKSPQPVISSSSPDPYQDWKTYQNQNLGFSVRYPKEWFVQEYGSYAANFTLTSPQIQESSSAAVRIRFNRLAESVDLKTFEKIYSLVPEETFFELLDVRSKVVKIRNFDVEGTRAVEYTVDRIFTALEGPKTEYSHVYEIEKEDVILKFSSSATVKEEELRGDGIFQQMIASFKF